MSERTPAEKADRKRREPWRDYPRIDRRLHDWSDWLRAQRVCIRRLIGIIRRMERTGEMLA